ncbi:MAG: aminoglycoside phosphotransferase [Firmicutes bacterium]|nr:aminoglycoside phosphotransferase [Bacillota bacterium]
MVTEFTAEAASSVLQEACRTAGLDPSGAELLRLGSNAVYRLMASSAIVRIARNPDTLDEMERVVRVARWLETENFPATRALAGVTQPSLIAGRVVTFWESAQERVEYATVGELADLLRRLHWLEEPESLRLPYFDPFAKLSASLRRLDGVAEDDRAFLEERAGRLNKEYDRLDFVLPFGMIHGDANIGNVLRHADGHAILESAVRIVAETGKPIAQVARDLGINEITLASWVSRARRAGGAGRSARARSSRGCGGRTRS